MGRRSLLNSTSFFICTPIVYRNNRASVFILSSFSFICFSSCLQKKKPRTDCDSWCALGTGNPTIKLIEMSCLQQSCRAASAFSSYLHLEDQLKSHRSCRDRAYWLLVDPLFSNDSWRDFQLSIHDLISTERDRRGFGLLKLSWSNLIEFIFSHWVYMDARGEMFWMQLTHVAGSRVSRNYRWLRRRDSLLTIR
jgi:hypothetical protein